MGASSDKYEHRRVLIYAKTIYEKDYTVDVKIYDALRPLPEFNFNCVKETEDPKGYFHKLFKTMVRYLTF